ncbi:MAG: hypothetical protein JO041_03995 [Acidobacteria bacterium]|nr:hypothetical protein [Acidobacteriota bacterium]
MTSRRAISVAAGCATALALFAAAPLARSELLDRVIASVNGKPILLSRAEEQARIAALLDGRTPQAISAAHRQAALDALIDQALVRKQMAQDPVVVTGGEVTARLAEIRGELNATGDEPWQLLLIRYQVDETAVRACIRSQLEQLKFIEARFRPSARAGAAEVEKFYREDYVPRIRRQGGHELPLHEVRAQIEQILTERQITSQMDGWLKSLRADSNVRVLVKFE